MDKYKIVKKEEDGIIQFIPMIKYKGRDKYEDFLFNQINPMTTSMGSDLHMWTPKYPKTREEAEEEIKGLKLMRGLKWD